MKLAYKQHVLIYSPEFDVRDKKHLEVKFLTSVERSNLWMKPMAVYCVEDCAELS